MKKNEDRYALLTEEFYRSRALKVEDKDLHEQTAKKVGWHSYSVQHLGFENSTAFSEIEWSGINSILDIGCGCGNLVEYLREERGFIGKYTGIDIVPEFIRDAKSLYGKDPRNNFILDDFLTIKWEKKYDIALAIGVLSVNYDSPEKQGKKSMNYAFQAIKLLAELSNFGISLTFINQESCADLLISSNPDMSFYKSSEIRRIIESIYDGKHKSLIIENYPNKVSIRGVARVILR
ncbi:MAG: class I SAM-dependent methyltransferase [Tildeniella torsiva UHER 1998/13D]|jgi:SAM-dependent methyltransferase|nr:class I SAM-dependent methyltransferase [Tildeniella torsiva UHER 1998/13D]